VAVSFIGEGNQSSYPRVQKMSWFVCFKLEVFIWCHVVNVPKSSIAFRGILICVIYRPGDMDFGEQPQILKDLNHFDLKCYLNCPIRIEIITGSHIFILSLPQVVTLCPYCTPPVTFFFTHWKITVKERTITAENYRLRLLSASLSLFTIETMDTRLSAV
jgi:hypothetical protein